MSEFSSEQDARRWKQQYYDHLDLLDKKEKDWQALESVLKKAVLRLSLAAEGQHASIDRYLHDIRAEVKGRVNLIKFENSLEQISALLLKMGGKQGADRKVIATLERLLQELNCPAAAGNNRKKLLKKLARSTDDSAYELAGEVQGFLSATIARLTADSHNKKSWLKNLFSTSSPADDVRHDRNTTPADRISGNSTGENTDYDLTNDNSGDARAASLAETPAPAANDSGYSESVAEPSIREILIRLLEQLMVSPDLLEEVDSLKHRIEATRTDTNWKHLLRDVAQLINTLRSRMQEEKLEFETFLQQITGRLKEMDSFLAIENATINEAEQAGEAFDAVVTEQVQVIHDDMSTANDLDELKHKVERRLNVVSDHIKQYRNNEQERYAGAQRNLEDMQSRLVMLEQESGDLRKLILEKNREAMFDALTGIPNRLSYEKKAAEELARCNRFASPLCMAVWDIDLFKQVNDTYGHKVGDKVIKVIAQLLNERIRETDFIARYGGEEFVMFLPGTDETEALKLADALREKVASSKFKHHEEVIKITVSCGISSFTAGDNHETMFERADKALYDAKHNGRNQCLLAS